MGALARLRQAERQIAEIMDRARAKGRVSVRRSLFRMAAANNVAAAIFLAKNLLGYKDVRNYDGSWTEWGNLVGAPIVNLAAAPVVAAACPA